MKKIIVIGCPGSGKSTFSRALHNATKIPLFHLDMLMWNSDKTTVAKDVFLKRLKDVLSYESWIIDGNYGSTMEMRLNDCDTVFFLDYPTDICLDGINQRKGKPRADMPWIETEDDEEFLEFIRNYNTESRPKVVDLLCRYNYKDIIIFKNRKEADDYITALEC